MSRQFPRLVLVVVAMVLFLAGRRGWSAPPQALDWSQWRRMPVFHDGRIMPVNTFARMTVEEICGRANPTLAPGEKLPPEARWLFPHGKPRRFDAAELLFSWLAFPEQWEHVPLLAAGYEPLRTEVLGLPVHDVNGRRLKYVSPAEVENNSRFWNFLREMSAQERQQSGKKKKRSVVQQRAADLYGAYSLYRQLTYNPQSPHVARSAFLNKLAQFGHSRREVLDSWKRLRPVLMHVPSAAQQVQDEAAWERLHTTLRTLGNLAQQDDAQLPALDEAASALRSAAQTVAEQLARLKDRLPAEAPPAGWPADQWEQVGIRLRAIAFRAEELAQDAVAVHWALYDPGYTLRLVPALDPQALEKNRSPETERHPWLALQCVLYGSKSLLADYPDQAIEEVRKAYQQAVAAYGNEDPARAEEFASATRRFADAVRRLAEQIEPLRQQLPIAQRDEELIRITAYPPPGYTAAEVHYYEFDPFCWSWVLSALAMAALGLAFGLMRRPMFWLGTLLMAAALGLIGYGFGLRVYITGWAPVTNMFESMLFVAFVVGLMGLWLALYPLFGPGLAQAWQMAALPKFFHRPAEDREETPGNRGANARRTWNVSTAVRSVLRIALAGVVFVLLTCVPYGSDEGYTAIGLWPKTDVGASLPSLNDLVVWIVGICVLVLAMWWVSRAVLAAAFALVTVPAAWRRTGLAEPIRQTMNRKPFALAGAAVTLLTALVAYYAPVSGKHLSPLMPVLRDNFWLTIHVLTITASYGAGALAWGLANIALGYYLFGRYTPGSAELAPQAGPAASGNASAEDAGGSSEPAPGEKSVLKKSGAAALFLSPRDRFTPRVPEPPSCTTLARFIYQATQAAVLLLAAGTIFGALWADVAWGRFWGWDSKEVWALISLLVYLAILHARYTGWVGNFGLAAGSLAGATSILMAWYGVNYVLGSGLHSYGEGAGGFTYVVGTLVANWLFAVLAALRYRMETAKASLLASAQARESTTATPAAAPPSSSPR